MGQFLLLGTEESLIALQLRQHDVQVSIEAAREYTKDAEQLKILDSIQSLQADLNSASNNIVAQYQEGNQEQALALYREGTYKSIQDGLRSHCGLLNGLNEEAISRTRNNAMAEATKTIQFLLTTGIIIFLLGLFAIVFLPRSITRPLEELTRVSKKSADGDLSVVPESERDEVGTLAAALPRWWKACGIWSTDPRKYRQNQQVRQDFSTAPRRPAKPRTDRRHHQDVAQGAEHQVERVNDISRSQRPGGRRPADPKCQLRASDSAAAQELAQTEPDGRTTVA